MSERGEHPVEFVLIHGTTQSSAGWQRLGDELTRLGHQPVTVDLPNNHSEFTVDDYASIAAEQAGRPERRRIAVAHSGSGILLSAIAESIEATAMVWLAAYVPDFGGGRSLIEELESDPAKVFNTDWIGADPVGDPQLAQRFLFHDCPAETMPWAMRTLRKFVPTAAYGQKPPPTPPNIPSSYILPTADRTLRPDWMRHAAADRLGVSATDIRTGHCPHVANPAAVAAILGHIAHS